MSRLLTGKATFAVPIAPPQAAALTRLKAAVLQCHLPPADFCHASDRAADQAGPGMGPAPTTGASARSVSDAVPTELHVSLSRTQPIQLPQKRALLSALRKSAASWKPMALQFGPFKVRFLRASLQWWLQVVRYVYLVDRRARAVAYVVSQL